MSRRRPAVSVVMAVHNGERYLSQAIDSVLGQTRGDFDFLIIDDGSTDATAEIVAERAEGDPRIALHRVPHAGRSAALNLGCSLARTEFIARLDADDLALPERLELQLGFLEANEEIVLLGGAALLIDEHGEVFRRARMPTSDSEIREAIERYSPFIHSNVVFRREAVAKLGGYRGAFEPAEDLDLWLRIVERHPVANLPEFVGKYRYYAEQESVVYAEAQAIGALAARTSSLDRSEGRQDRFETADRIDAEALAAAGVEPSQVTEEVTRYAIWLAETLSRARQPRAASALWELAIARAHSPSAPAALREEVDRVARPE